MKGEKVTGRPESEAIVTSEQIEELQALYEKATQQPLMVYTSNSWRRIGLASHVGYDEVIYPCRSASDGHPDLAGRNIGNDLEWLVALHNAWPSIRASLRSVPGQAEPLSGAMVDALYKHQIQPEWHRTAQSIAYRILDMPWQSKDDQRATLHADIACAIRDAIHAAPVQPTREAVIEDLNECIDAVWDLTGSDFLSGEGGKPADRQFFYKLFCRVGNRLTSVRDALASSVVPASPQKDEAREARPTTSAENMRLLAARLDAHMSPAERRELNDAARLLRDYEYLRAHWSDFTGCTSKNPGKWLDETIDRALAAAAPGREP